MRDREPAGRSDAVRGEAFHISSLVVYVLPPDVCAVRDAIRRLDGAEIHAMTAEGRMIVTLENPDAAAMHARVAEIGGLAGVRSVALVFHHAES